MVVKLEALVILIENNDRETSVVNSCILDDTVNKMRFY